MQRHPNMVSGLRLIKTCRRKALKGSFLRWKRSTDPKQLQ
jgi:hypothetical protein